jgi:hypothetical protein
MAEKVFPIRCTCVDCGHTWVTYVYRMPPYPWNFYICPECLKIVDIVDDGTPSGHAEGLVTQNKSDFEAWKEWGHRYDWAKMAFRYALLFGVIALILYGMATCDNTGGGGFRQYI